MLHKSLLVTLSRQGRTENKSNEENFLTAAFAYLLSLDQNLLRKYVKLILPRTRIPSELDVGVQTPYQSGVVDIDIFGKDIALFQENKIEAQEGHDQLKRYASELSKREEKHRLLIYLTVDPEKGKPRVLQGIPVKSLLWRDVADFLKEHHSQGMAKLVRDEVYHFLEVKNMILPQMLNVSKLTVRWKGFTADMDGLKYMITKAKELIEEVLHESQYKIKENSDLTSVYLSVYRRRGKLARLMKPDTGNLYAWCGVYYDEGQTYFGASIAGHKRYPALASARFLSMLSNEGFERTDPDYPNYVTYYYDELLRKVLGRKKDIKAQADAVSKWMVGRAKALHRLLDCLERRW
jgi:hypothetical protein